jgi:diguanylate cyclase (GGDEF)-like protein/PAS domain S-box-containing protein
VAAADGRFRRLALPADYGLALTLVLGSALLYLLGQDRQGGAWTALVIGLYLLGCSLMVLALLRSQRTEAQYRLLFEHNPLPFWVFHRQTFRILEANEAALRQYGYSRAEFQAMGLADIRPAEDVAEALAVAGGDHPEQRRGRVWRHVRKDGAVINVAVHSADIDFRGEPARLVLALDLSERLHEQQRLERSESRFQMVARATSDAVFDWNIVTGESWRSASFATLFKYGPDDMPSSIAAWQERIHPEDRARVDASLEAVFASRASEWRCNYRFLRGDGSYAHVLDRGLLERATDGSPSRMVGGMVDVTGQHEYESRLAFQASHDELTGLLNRGALLAALEQRVAAAGDQPLALLYLDINNFKLINDSLGHDVGDEVLRVIARRLLEIVGSAERIGRIGGNEFLILLDPRPGDPAAATLPARILAWLAEPVEALETLHYLTLNAGVARYPEHGRTPALLFKNAGLATHEAKRRGHNHLVEFTAAFESAVVDRQQLVSRLHEAIEQDEFELFFQPLFSTSPCQPVGLEALIRWRHPQRGLVPPSEFIPVCEDSGLIVPLGRWVLREACRYHHLLKAAGWGHLSIAVNVSALQFLSGELQHDVPALLREFQIPPGVLELELTESLVMENPESVIEVMRELRQHGVLLSIDDFGTGYSSMSYLHRLPVDKLKIDRSFVANVETDHHNAAICDSILALARSFELQVIAEGVETQAQFDWLRGRGCEQAQGYLLARPQPFAEMIASLGTAVAT